MANKYYSEDGAGDASSPLLPGSVSSISWAAGDTYHLLDRIITATSIGQSGGSGNVITVRGDYAGREAILDGQGVTNNMLGFNVKAYIDIKNITFDNPSDSGSHQLLYIDRGQIINVTGCTFNNTGGYAGNALKMYVQSGANGLNRVLIDNNTFNDIDKSCVVLTNYSTESAGVPYGITVSNNTFNNCFQVWQYIQNTSTWAQLDGGFSPYGIDIDGNTLNNCIWAFTQVEWLDGFGSVNGYTSYIRNNTINNNGAIDSEFNNCIQLEAAKGGYVEGNFVNGHTKFPDGGDGHAFIFDYKKDSTTASYFTDGVIVRNNIFKGAASAGGSNHCAGIKCYRGTNNIVYNNIIDGCLVGMSNSYGFPSHDRTRPQ